MDASLSRAEREPIMRAGILAASVAVLAAVVWLTVQTQRNSLVLDHFDVVKPRILYRSGQLTLDQLDDVVTRHGIRTLVNFQIPGAPVSAEAALAKRHGIDFMNLPMPGDGLGEEDQFREVMKAIDDPHRRPVLVHCARGTCRTGAMVAMYRLERDGWTIEDVDAEMERQSYDDGRIAGYVYRMVRHKPMPDIYEPRIRIDRNLPPPAPEPPPAAREPLPILPPLTPMTRPGTSAPEIAPLSEVPHVD
ncbi:MAG: tyrosine-protein phosphatase [Isosphaeraceae bacterium]|nr:tyrosine-protein phosphatase [Isosphaeraceae bacterium]